MSTQTRTYLHGLLRYYYYKVLLQYADNKKKNHRSNLVVFTTPLLYFWLRYNDTNITHRFLFFINQRSIIINFCCQKKKRDSIKSTAVRKIHSYH